jgi:hypothetical protein
MKSWPGIDALAMELASIESGHDPVAADSLIRFFHSEMQSGNLFANGIGPKEKTFLRFIEIAFKRYVDPEKKSMKSLDTAFGLTRPKGRSADGDDLPLRNIGIAAYIVLRMRNDVLWLDAIGDAANTFFPDGSGQSACEAAYAEFKDVLRTFPTKHLEILSDQIPRI